MPVTRSFWFIALFVVMILKFNPVAEAANCWNGSPSGLDFGTITPEQIEITAARPSFICNNYDGQVGYIRACLKVMTGNPLAMSQNRPSNIPLYFPVYSIYNQHPPLSQNNNVYTQTDFVLSTGGAAEHDILLIGKINPGQTNTSTGIYYDYATAIQIAYTPASSLQALPACGALNGIATTDQTSASAMAESGCEVTNVDDMAFGSRGPAQNDLLQVTSTTNIAVQCPIGTDYPISISHGLHPKGNQRSMCRNGECINYAPYQGAAHSMEWTQGNPGKQHSTDGRAQNLVVYGSVPAQKWLSPGGRTDTVVIMLTY